MEPSKSKQKVIKKIKSYMPILEWAPRYNRPTLTNDLIVALIVTMMLIPQSLAYALLAGVPAEVGLYASMLPLILYAIFGTSRALSVGPVAVTSLMVAAAAGQLAMQGTPEYMGAAVALAMVSGLLLMAMGFLKLGFLANFLSHPVITGFITASSLQIAAGQLGPVLGMRVDGESFMQIIVSLWENISDINPWTAGIGLGALIFLFWVRSGLNPVLQRIGMGPKLADIMVKIGPVVIIIITILIVSGMDLVSAGVKVVGEVPEGLPAIKMPPLDMGLWAEVLVPALLISIVGYVESISVALTLAAKKRQHVDPNQELIALGASNIGSAVSGGFPVTGGFSRSVVNFDAGAETPAAGVFTAIAIALTTLFLTPLLYFLPNATLAATIIVAVLSLVDIKAIKSLWVFSKFDFAALAITILVTLIAGIEPGLISGIALSLILHLYNISRPHIAIVGQIPGTTTFRNVDRNDVVTHPEIISLRIDESLFFPNARYIEEYVNNVVSTNPEVKNVILECPAVNSIDSSALESLEMINDRLKDADVALHLSEVKGPIMDRLKRSTFLDELTGGVHLSQFSAIYSIDPEFGIKTRDTPISPESLSDA